MAIVATGELALTPDLKGLESKLSSSMDGIGKKAGAELGRGIDDAGRQAGDNLEKELSEAGERAGDATSKSFSASFAKVTGKITAISGAFTTLFGALTLKAAKAEQQQVRLEAAVKRTGNEFDDYEDELKAAVKQQEKFGFTAGEVREGLITLTRKLGDPKKAFEALGLVADVAADKNIGFSDAVGKVSKLMSGNAKEFATYGINLKDAAKLQGLAADAAENLAKAQERLGKAQGDLSDLEAVLEDKRARGKALTIQDEFRLRDARKEVADATAAVSSGTAALDGANAGLAGSAGSAAKALETLGLQLDGISEAKADTTAGKIDNLQARIANLQETLALKFGPSLTVASGAITALSGVATVAGVVVQLGLGAALGSIVLGLAAFAASFTITMAVLTNWGDDVTRITRKVKGAFMDTFDTVKAVVMGIVGWVERAIERINALINRISQIKLPGGVSLGGAAKGVASAAGTFIPALGLLKRAAGGPFAAGQPMLVGERGPELVRFGRSGTVYPNGSMGGVVFGPGSVVVSFAGAVSEQQAYTVGQAVGRGAAYEMERAEARRAARVA